MNSGEISDKAERAVKMLRESRLSNYVVSKQTRISQGTLGNYKNGKTKPTPANAEILLQFFDSKEPAGGTVATKDSFFEYSIGGNEIKPTAELSGKPPYETYLLPLSAMGGPLSGFAADSVTLANCEKIVSPIEDVDFAITIYGESMYPKYPSGARLLIKKINPDIFIDWGKAYVLDTSNGVIVKEVRMSDREGCIACHSINPDPKFRPFDVPLSEVYGMYRVLMSLSAE